jgi:putative tryptophan/tyrosine transport system substrate-binding protein
VNRRTFIAGLGSTAGWPLAARAQQPAMPVIGVINGTTRDGIVGSLMVAFHAGLAEMGFVEGQNVAIVYHWLGGRYDRLPAVVADLIERRVSVIATPGEPPAALAAKAATSTIPIVFGVGEDPVRLGLVANLAQPGGNATGMNFFATAAVPKRLGLLHELLPKIARIAVLVNPSNMANTEAMLREVQNAARAIGLSVDVFQAGSVAEIETTFQKLARERVDALYVAGDAYFTGRRIQLATWAARHGVPTSFSNRAHVEAGGLMSYGTDLAEMFHQVGVYTGQILKGAKPANLPVVQATKFEFVINIQTARALGIEVPPVILARADEVIE